jgi:plastocyanin domain-containing protein
MRFKNVLCMCLVFVFLCLASHAMGQKNVYRATIDKDGVQRVSVTGGEYFFNPDYIVVKVNVPVELTIKKESGVVPHDIVMHEPDAGIDFSLQMASESKKVQFTPKKVGKYPYYCTKKLLFFKSHRERGMEGTLEVVE